MKDPYIVSRVLTRREAVSSSSIEGTHSTLDELLSVEETGDDGARREARQVRNYAEALDGFIPLAGKGRVHADRAWQRRMPHVADRCQLKSFRGGCEPLDAERFLQCGHQRRAFFVGQLD
ncbi:Fic/DOC family N-terminal domain-containing protein [Bradyrhizobium sp. DASA03120]|uniref:Fic/DOC family N-terminal domain-containing protein n=1 Tax=Bradyrhizobium sp. SMVTL-02 TaxID=3395917 RepID=UPI003F6FDF89